MIEKKCCTRTNEKSIKLPESKSTHQRVVHRYKSNKQNFKVTFNNAELKEILCS